MSLREDHHDHPMQTEEHLASVPSAPEATPIEVVTAAIEATLSGDAGALFEPHALAALSALRKERPADYQRVRAQIKRECKPRGVSITALERHTRGESQQSEVDNVATQVIELIEGCAELWHDKDGTPYASIDLDGHPEHWPIESSGFSKRVSYLAYRELGVTVSPSTWQTVAGTLAGKAEHDGKEYLTAKRAASHEGRCYLDLCNDVWQVVEIDANGWRIVQHSPIRFHRTKSMLALPEPARGGQIGALWAHVNVSPEDQPLVLAWLLQCSFSGIGYAVLALEGRQGSAKSTTQRRLKQLVDPNKVDLRGAPKVEADAYVAGHNAHVVSYENLSHLSEPLQDALCAMSTGGGFAGRQLFTNSEENTAAAHNPIVLNSITNVVTRGDLAERAICLELPQIDETTRKTDSDINACWEQDYPLILGAVLDLLAATLAKLPSVTLERLPRMADFARIGEAMNQHLGAPHGEFVRLFAANQGNAALGAIESSPAIMALHEHTAGWKVGHSETHLTGEWLRLLDARKSDGHGWPKSAKGLGDALRRYEVGLKRAGLSVEFGRRTMRGIPVTVARIADVEEGSTRSRSNVVSIKERKL